VDKSAKVEEAGAEVGDLGGAISKVEGGREVGAWEEGGENINKDLGRVDYMGVYKGVLEV